MKAIETWYVGHKFRSRLEARWAVFFETLGWQWKYEDQGYHVGGEYYLPDFHLAPSGQFVEVKGDPEALRAQLPLLKEFVRQADRDLVLLTAVPEVGPHLSAAVHPLLTRIGDEVRCVVSLVSAEEAGGEFIATTTDFPLIALGKSLGLGGLRPDERVTGAYLSARSARFEHGQVGAIR